MPQTFREKLINFLRRFKIPLILFGVLILLGLTISFAIKNQSALLSSILKNPLKQTNNRTNFLLLGVAGGDHDGADLTDTMIFASFNQKTGQVTLITIPRDIWSVEMVAKVNTAYHYGGLSLAKTTVEKIVGLPVHYTAKIDLKGLGSIVDALGGVNINVQNSFDDYKFPIEGKENDLCDGDPELKCRYLHLHFNAGWQVMTGQRALEYIRSREAEGKEGTDFARSARQMKLILAIKNKIFSKEVILDPQKIASLIKTTKKIIESDIPQNDFLYLGKMAMETNFGKMKTLSIDEFLINPPTEEYQGQWVLVPEVGDYSKIQEFVKKQL